MQILPLLLPPLIVAGLQVNLSMQQEEASCKRMEFTVNAISNNDGNEVR